MSKLNKRKAENVINFYSKIIAEGKPLNDLGRAELQEAQDYILSFNLKKSDRKRTAKRWKSDEDWVCEKFGLKREGHMKRGLSVPDGVNDLFSVEVTHTNKPLTFINKKLDEAKIHASQGRTPVAVVIQDGKPRDEGFWIVRIKHARDLHGKWEVN